MASGAIARSLSRVTWAVRSPHRGSIASRLNPVRTRAKNSATEGPHPAHQKSPLLTPRSEDFSRWYLDIIKQAELADNGPVRGTMIIRPYAYALWENIQQYLDVQFKALGVDNGYFPMFIPYSFIEKEANHIEGFFPELALVTKGGGKDLEEAIVVRPTSETIVNNSFKDWISSYRDLPLLFNQWANVVRWEMRTRPFLRTLEFLWQEGHTCHEEMDEADNFARSMLDVYVKFAEDVAAIAVVRGSKSRIERFAGADATYTIEAMMGDGKALQCGTSHFLGQNFSKSFDITFLDNAGARKHVWQTSWGVSTRLIGGIIMSHGDDKGLCLPPRLAPYQVVVTLIFKKGVETTALRAFSDRIVSSLVEAGVRVKVDDDPNTSPGYKFNFWEMKGVPLRIEIGAKDAESGTVVLARRDQPGRDGKRVIDAVSVSEMVRTSLDDMHFSMLERSRLFRESNTVDVQNYDEFKAAISEGKWARGYWGGTDSDERQIKEDCQATLRCFPFDAPAGHQSSGKCFFTEGENGQIALFARSY